MSDASPYFHQQKLNLASELWQAEKHDQAIATLNEILADDPYHVDASFSLGLFYYRLKEYQKARALFLPFLFQGETAARAKFNLGKVAFAENNKKEAARLFRECLYEYPNHALTLAWFARCSPEWNQLAQTAAKQAEQFADEDLQTLSIVFFAYHEQTAPYQTKDEKRIFDTMKPYLNDDGKLYFRILTAEKVHDYRTIVNLISDYEQKYPEDHSYHSTLEFYQNQMVSAQENTNRHPNAPSHAAFFWFIVIFVLVQALIALSRGNATKYNGPKIPTHFPSYFTTAQPLHTMPPGVEEYIKQQQWNNITNPYQKPPMPRG